MAASLPCVWLPGCGSGLSGETLSEAGHYWVGLDISPAMLGEWEGKRMNQHVVSKQSNEVREYMNEEMGKRVRESSAPDCVECRKVQERAIQARLCRPLPLLMTLV